MWSIELPSGVEYQFSVANGLAFRGVQGNGMPPIQNVISPHALIDGALYQRTFVRPRVLTFMLDAIGTSTATLDAIRVALIALSNPHRGVLPVKIWYRPGAAGTGRYLNAYYEAGLEGGLTNGFVEDSIALRFLATEPMWYYETPIAGVALDAYDSMAVANRIIHRDAQGAWDGMAGGADGIVNTVIGDSSGNIYAGGQFTNIGGVAAARIARYNGIAWSALGAGLDGACYSLAIAPNGNLYACGAFATAGGVAVNYIAMWNGASWVALGTGLNAVAYIIVFDTSGNLYVGGAFTTAGGAAANYVAMWNGSAWSEVGNAGFPVYAMDFATDGKLYVCVMLSNISVWNGAAWTVIATLNGASPGVIRAMPNGEVLVAAGFSIGGVPTNAIRKWNGVSWTTLYGGGGTYNWISQPDEAGNYHIACSFSPGGWPVAYYTNYGIWTGSMFVTGPIGKTTGGGALLYEILTLGDDLVLAGNFIAATVPGVTLIDNVGSARGYPIVTIAGPGLLLYLANYTTGQVIYFDITLLAGETLTIDFTTGAKTIKSSWRGNMISKVIAGTLVNWHLAPGDNYIGCYVDGATAAATYGYTPTYWSAY